MVIHSEQINDLYKVSDVCSITKKYITSLPTNKYSFLNGSYYVHETELPYLLKKAKDTKLHSNLDYKSLPTHVRKSIEFVLFNKKKIRLNEVPTADNYSILHLTPNAPSFIIDSTWKAILKNCHPDVGGDSEIFLKYKGAYESITKEHSRVKK